MARILADFQREHYKAGVINWNSARYPGYNFTGSSLLLVDLAVSIPMVMVRP